MRLSLLRVAGVSGLITLGSLTAAWAQAPGGEPSMGCRLFPLACPGPVPAPPPPLLGTPEEQAATAAPPPPVARHAKRHARARKHAAATPAQ